MKKTWAFIWHFLLLGAGAFVGPFLVLYYQHMNLNGGQIGLLVGLTPLIRLLAVPVGTGLADVTRQHRLAMSLGLLVAGASACLLPVAGTFGGIAVLVSLSSAFSAPVMPLATSATMFMLGKERAAYGRIRLGGTIGYALAGAVAGTVADRYGLGVSFRVAAVLYLLLLAVSQMLEYARPEAKASLRRGARMLLSDARWLLFLAMAFAGGLAWVATNAYLFAYMAAVGAQESVMGIALTLGVVAEVPVLFFGDRLVRRLGSYGLFRLALAVSGVRLLLFAACRGPIPALAVQLTNGLAFPAMSLAGSLYAEEHAPAGLRASAQGLFGSVLTGLGGAIGGLAGGPLLDHLGARGMYLIFGLFVLAACAVGAAIVRRMQAGRELPGTL